MFLKIAARRLQAEVWPDDLISRHGGDEFVIVLAGADAATGAARGRAAAGGDAASRYSVEGVSLPASASIGISLCPGDGADSATLLRNADTAMYRAKREGRSTYRFFTAEMNAHGAGPAAARRAAARGARRRASCSSPTSRRSMRAPARSPASRRCRAGPIRRWRDAAEPLHSAGRRLRADRADRRICAARGLPAAAALGRRRGSSCRRSRSISRRIQFRNRNLPETVRKALEDKRHRRRPAGRSRSPRA